ncbi:MurR/RpiR family transcriptional regulator [Lacticaseibacillus zhaodongensis]|uniref:MurR/RpiR family transcriptional regulator n=1 Tax=Lacticaseibacillus zhaodongensis TaxID=2668065 RepID=UPI0012D2DA65|nr:MurR/RpiR family transcriptional regulator [Lacticaseibacillus zhaodongensis]
MSVTGNIEQIKTSLSATEKRLAEYVLKEPQAALQLNSQELADATAASAATVTRFAHHLGFKSFTELKLQLAADVSSQENQEDWEPDIKANEQVSDITAKLLHNAERAMHETADQVRPEVVSELVTTLKHASQIICFGVGASYLIAQDIAQKWTRLGYNIVAGDDLNCLLPLAVSGDPERKVFWFVSNSGESPEAIVGARMAHDAGCTVVAITGVGRNSLAALADIALQTSDPLEAKMRIAATQSLHAQLFLVDAVFYAFTSSNYEGSVHVISSSRKLVSDYKDELRRGVAHRHNRK